MLSISEVLIPLVAVALVIVPLILIASGAKLNAKKKLIAQIAVFCGVFAVTAVVQASKFTVLAEEAGTAGGASDKGIGFIAAALAVAASSLGAAWAVAKAAPAALGAISENPDNFGKAIIFVALGEGIAIYGLLISILIINNL